MMQARNPMPVDTSAVDLVQTPTLQAVSTEDESALVEDLEVRVAEAIREAEESPEVVQAVDEQRAAEEAFRKLQFAARGLNKHVKEIRDRLATVGQATLDALIESAAVGAKADYSPAKDLIALEHRDRLAGKAIERVVEHLTPLALAARLRAESHALATRAKSIERAAQQRAEKLLGHLREAVSEEVVLPIDLSKGVAGAMLTHAGELKRLAREASENADRIESSYLARAQKD
jgi:hypothetical protein